MFSKFMSELFQLYERKVMYLASAQNTDLHMRYWTSPPQNGTPISRNYNQAAWYYLQSKYT